MRCNFRSILALLVFTLFAVASVARADSAVILGAGQVGTWFTLGWVTNPNSSAETLSVASVPFPCQPPLECPIPIVTVAANGTASLDSFLTGNFETFYVTQQESQPPAFPLVHASLINGSGAGRSVDIPVALVSDLISANRSTLSFGGVVEGPAVDCAMGVTCYFPHSTLVLGNIERTDGQAGEDLPVTLQLFDPDGTLVGTASLKIPYGQTILISDVVTYLRALMSSAGSLGQIRVTRTSGGALMWGILYTTEANGSVTASVGANRP